MVRIRLRPREAEAPLRVIAACLPFVCVKPPKGPAKTLDLRAVRLVRLDAKYGRSVSKELQK